VRGAGFSQKVEGGPRRQGTDSLSPRCGERVGVRGVDFARKLRKSSTDAERRLWYRLRGARLDGCKFRRQHPIGPFVADFACIERRLVVELDGGQHIELARRDAARSEYLRLRGWRVVRFWDNETLDDTDAVVECILESLVEPLHPDPLPAMRGEWDGMAGSAVEPPHPDPLPAMRGEGDGTAGSAVEPPHPDPLPAMWREEDEMAGSAVEPPHPNPLPAP